MKKRIYKVVFTSLFICVLIVSFSLSAFAVGEVSNPEVLQKSDIIYDFDLTSWLNSRSDWDSSVFSDSAFVGFFTYDGSLQPSLYFIAYSFYYSSPSSPLSVGPYTGGFTWAPVLSAYPTSLALRFQNLTGSTVYLKYYVCLCSLNGITSVSSAYSPVQVSANSSVRLFGDNMTANYSSYVAGTASITSSYFNVSSGSYSVRVAPVTFVGFGSKEVSPSSGESPLIPLTPGNLFLSPLINSGNNYGSLSSDSISFYTNMSSIPDKIAFNFTIDGEIVSDSYGDSCPGIVSPPPGPGPSGGGSSTSTGTVTPEYDQNGNIVNYDFNITTDNTDIINALNQSLENSPPSISDSSASDFESAVSDLPAIQDSDLNTVFNSYGFDSNNSAIRWIYSMINTIFNGNSKVFSVLLSFMVLSLLMLLLNKRGQ